MEADSRREDDVQPGGCPGSYLYGGGWANGWCIIVIAGILYYRGLRPDENPDRDLLQRILLKQKRLSSIFVLEVKQVSNHSSSLPPNR